MGTTILTNAYLVQDLKIEHVDVVIQDHIIESILPANHTTIDNATIYDLDGLYISSGFIDIHVHGGGGHDFMDGTIEAYHGVASLHLKHGTTAMMPTTLASSIDELTKAFSLYDLCKNGVPDGSKFIGLHIEGPYINPSQAGALDPRYIHNPDKEEYMKLLNHRQNIARWTIAPELDGSLEFGEILTKMGILPSIGHSQATLDQVRIASHYGYRHITHLYSAVSTIVRVDGYRHAGIVESAYLLDELTSEIIADGCHLPKDLLQLAYRFIGPKRLALVTDAMRGAGSTSGESILGSLEHGQTVIIEDGVAKLMDRSAFAGSVCTADRLVRTMVQLAQVPLPDAIRMITQTPAEIAGIDNHYGSVKVGRNADIVVFDKNINIKKVFLDGKLIITKE